MVSYIDKERLAKMKQTSLDIGDREHHKELLDLNLIVTIDKTFEETPQWLLDFLQKNMEKYGLRSMHAS